MILMLAKVATQQVETGPHLQITCICPVTIGCNGPEVSILPSHALLALPISQLGVLDAIISFNWSDWSEAFK